jgi:hypothetical protein
MLLDEIVGVRRIRSFWLEPGHYLNCGLLVRVRGDVGQDDVAAGEQVSAATSMKIVTSSQRALRTFIRVSLPSPAGAQDSTEKQRAVVEHS